MVKINKTKFKEAVKDTGGVITTIANKLGVSRKAVYDYLERNPELKDLLHHEVEKILDMAEVSLFNQVKDKDFAATKYILGTKGKSRGYVEKSEQTIEHTGEIFQLIVEAPHDGTKKRTD